MPQWRKDPDATIISANLEYLPNADGYLEIDVPRDNFAQHRVFSPKIRTNEEAWQAEIRNADASGMGIVGHSFDLLAFTAAMTDIEFVDRVSGLRIKSPVLQSKLSLPIWRDDKDLDEIIFSMVRYLASVGEYYLVKINGFYDIFGCNQKAKVEKIQQPNGEWISYTYFWQRDGEKEENWIRVPSSDVSRGYFSRPGANREAYSPGRRVLPEIRTAMQIMRQFQRIAFSNTLVTKSIYLGADDMAWTRDKMYMDQWADPSMAVPPVVNDLTNLGDSVAKGNNNAPWHLMMGPNDPKVLDLTTSFDENARQTLQDLKISIAEYLNIPAQMLLSNGEENHFGKYATDERLRNYGYGPLLRVALKHLYKEIFSSFANEYQYDAKLDFSLDKLAKSTLNPTQAIELFKVGAIGKYGILKILNVPEEYAVQTAEDDQRRRELLTGDSGLQQDLLAERDAQARGIAKNAVPDSAPLTDGKARQGEPKKVSAAFKDEKKKNSKT